MTAMAVWLKYFDHYQSELSGVVHVKEGEDLTNGINSLIRAYAVETRSNFVHFRDDGSFGKSKTGR